jgi:hypothetical protein
MLTGGAAAAPARVGDDFERAAALHNVDGNVGDAIKLERNAIYLVDHGNEAGARSEIKNSLELLDKALPATVVLNTPGPLRQIGAPDSSWDRLTENTKSAIHWDKEALQQGGGALAVDLGIALKKKEAVYSLVHAEIKSPMCTLQTNLESISVNGVVQSSQLDVGVNCTRPEAQVLIVMPGTSIAKAIPSPPTITDVMSAVSAMKLALKGQRSADVTIQTSQPMTGTQKIEVEIIPIAGDSHPPEVITRVP